MGLSRSLPKLWYVHCSGADLLAGMRALPLLMHPLVHRSQAPVTKDMFSVLQYCPYLGPRDDNAANLVACEGRGRRAKGADGAPQSPCASVAGALTRVLRGGLCIFQQGGSTRVDVRLCAIWTLLLLQQAYRLEVRVVPVQTSLVAVDMDVRARKYMRHEVEELLSTYLPGVLTVPTMFFGTCKV